MDAGLTDLVWTIGSYYPPHESLYGEVRMTITAAGTDPIGNRELMLTNTLDGLPSAWRTVVDARTSVFGRAIVAYMPRFRKIWTGVEAVGGRRNPEFD
jgi:hypothetical protein